MSASATFSVFLLITPAENSFLHSLNIQNSVSKAFFSNADTRNDIKKTRTKINICNYGEVPD